MLQLTPQSRIFVAIEPVDFRKGIDGLAAVCRQALGDNPLGGALYVFRKGRPTVVMLPNRKGDFHPSVTLCMHPIAYYQDTFAGGMVPTDDVIAHLLLMRADEANFWRRSNQHPIDRIEAGI